LSRDQLVHSGSAAQVRAINDAIDTLVNQHALGLVLQE
jgi:hypothetical protein